MQRYMESIVQRNMRGEVENMGEDVDTQQELPVHVVHVTHIHDMYITVILM